MPPKKSSKRKTNIDTDQSSTKRKKTIDAAVTLAKSTTPKRSNSSATKKKETANRALIVAWHDTYRDKEDELQRITPTGFGQWMQDLEFDLEGAEPIILSYRLQLDSMGFVTKDQWVKAMERLKLKENQDIVRSKQSLLDVGRPMSQTFRELMKWTFSFVKAPEQRCVDLDVANAIMSTLLKGKGLIYFDEILRFLEEKRPVKVLNRDQWENIYDFSTKIAGDLSDYSDEGAWPTLIDDFVVWYKQQEKK